MRKFILLSLLSLPLALVGQFVEKDVEYSLEDTTFKSTIVYPESVDNPVPGVLMVPNWMGPTKPSLEKAKKVAAMGYVVMMVDMYGKDVRPESSREAGQAAGKVRDDRTLMRARMKKAHEVFVAQAENVPLEKSKLAAIGFCFGGGAILEYARSGADIDVFASFHGDLISPTLEADSANIRGRVLVLHGAEDPVVPQEDVQAFVDAMLKTKADWQLVQFSNAVHSFTNPDASSEGRSHYHSIVSKRAFEMMKDLFEETF